MKQRLWGWIAGGLALVVSGCSDPAPIIDPITSDLQVTGNLLTWTTDQRTLGQVLIGNQPGVYDRVAYPRASSRGDKAFITEHRVPILSAEVGDTVFVKTQNVTEDRRTVVGNETRVILTGAGARPLLQWTMIDVGFGDSHLLTLPSVNRRIMIDAGERDDFINVDRFLEGRGITRIDCAMATHIHADHLGGFVGSSRVDNDGVAGKYEIGLFIDSPFKSHFRSAYPELLGLLEDRGVPLDTVFVNDDNTTNPALDWDPLIRVEVLNSGFGRNIGGSSQGDQLNNDSIVLRISYGEVNLVMGGDSENEVEGKMLADRGELLESEVLKIHHHGLNDTSVPGFLDAVNPRVGMIPIATYESSFGDLPSGSVLERMRDRDIDVYSCDRAFPLGVQANLNRPSGHHVHLTTDGLSYEVRIEDSESRYSATLPGEPRIQ